jgi:hypothetical protein
MLAIALALSFASASTHVKLNNREISCNLLILLFCATLFHCDHIELNESAFALPYPSR